MIRPKTLSMVAMVFRRGFAGKPGCQGDAGFAFMQDQHGSVALADDQIAFPLAGFLAVCHSSGMFMV
jgi:hypothetical protein